MVQFQNTYGGPAPAPETGGRQTDWSGEISLVSPGTSAGMGPGMAPNSGGMDMEELARSGTGRLNMQHGLAADVIEAPTTVNEAYLGSLKAMLARNLGNYIVATFLVGTQNTVSWEGILYDVGNDYLTIYQEGRDRYIVSDMYALKFMEFYDTERRRRCDAVLRERGWQGSLG